MKSLAPRVDTKTNSKRGEEEKIVTWNLQTKEIFYNTIEKWNAELSINVFQRGIFKVAEEQIYQKLSTKTKASLDLV